MGAHSTEHGRPWLVGGDFQIPAETPQASQIPQSLKGSVVASGVQTCTQGKHGSIIDYFIVDNRVQGYFAMPSALMDSPFKPHRPVEAVATGGWQKTTAVYAKTPKRFSEHRLIGPFLPPQDWAEVGRALEGGCGAGSVGDDADKGGNVQEAWNASGKKS